ncbi:MAG: hypothetical protein J5I93_02100 [Pirellulaceae bacterium]|nr:hypothetical protein [Pirellulaceae bacterium]
MPRNATQVQSLATSDPQKPARGIIRRGEVYPLAEVYRRLGVGAATLREARKRGLKIRRIGRNSFVLGDDVCDYLATTAKTV